MNYSGCESQSRSLDAPDGTAFSATPSPGCPSKPWARGLTYVRDMGLPVGELEKRFVANGSYVDIVKLADCPASPDMERGRRAGGDVSRPRRGRGSGPTACGLGSPKWTVDGRRVPGPNVRTQNRECGGLSSLHLTPDREYSSVNGDVRDRGIRPLLEIGVAYGVNEEGAVDIHVERLISTMRRAPEPGRCSSSPMAPRKASSAPK